MRVSLFLVSVIAFLAAGCVRNTNSEVELPQNGEIIQDLDLVSQIVSSPDTITIDDVEYTVESYAWRDFMPSVTPPVRLNSNSTLIRTDETAIQSNVEIIQQYIVRENAVWIPDESEVSQNQSSPNQLHIVSREGPTWEIGSKVRVGLKIKDQEADEVFLISAPNVPIVKTQ